MTRGNLYSTNPFAVIPNGFDGSQVARIEDVFRGGKQFALFQIVVGVAGADGDELQHARVAVAVNHAARAAVADELRVVPFPDLAHRLLPEMAAIQIQIPVEVKILVPAEAAEFFLLAAQMPLHLVERFRRVHNGIAAVFFHLLDFFKQLDQFGVVEIHQPTVAETQITARERSQRITERAAFEAERFEEFR